MNIKTVQLLVAIIFFFVGTITQTAAIHNKEKDALFALFIKTSGYQWNHKTNWNKLPGTDEPLDGVDRDSTVRGIRLPNNKLRGSLPDAMKYLVNLEILDLSKNELGGKIPDWLGKCKKLRVLNLSDNQFTGEIPHWIGELENLEVLNLENNCLGGGLPESFGKLKKLRIINIGSNRLVGEIPVEFIKLETLEKGNSNFEWNGLYTRNPTLMKFLNTKQIDGSWIESQTIPPEQVFIKNYTEDATTIAWKPTPLKDIKYQYIFLIKEKKNPYKKINIDVFEDESIHEITPSDLNKDTRYCIQVLVQTPPHNMNQKNAIESLPSNELCFSTKRIKMSGRIIDIKTKIGVPGIKIAASNGVEDVESNSEGKYEFLLLPGWQGRITLKAVDCSVNPGDFTINTPLSENAEDIVVPDFIINKFFKISGKITHKDQGVNNVNILFTDNIGNMNSTFSKADGSYEMELPFNWTGTIKAKKEYHSFLPERIDYRKEMSPEHLDFQTNLYKIHGYIKKYWRKNMGIKGIELEISGSDKDKSYLITKTLTDHNGRFEFDVMSNWKGSLYPTRLSRKKNIIRPIYYFLDYLPSEDIIFRQKNYYKYYCLVGISRGFQWFYSTNEGNIGTANPIVPTLGFGYQINNGLSLFSRFDQYYYRKQEANNIKKYNLLLHSNLNSGVNINLDSSSFGFEYNLFLGITVMNYSTSVGLTEKNITKIGCSFGYGITFNPIDRTFLSGVCTVYVDSNDTKMVLGLIFGYRF